MIGAGRRRPTKSSNHQCSNPQIPRSMTRVAFAAEASAVPARLRARKVCRNARNSEGMPPQIEGAARVVLMCREGTAQALTVSFCRGNAARAEARRRARPQTAQTLAVISATLSSLRLVSVQSAGAGPVGMAALRARRGGRERRSAPRVRAHRKDGELLVERRAVARGARGRLRSVDERLEAMMASAADVLEDRHDPILE